MMTMAVMMMVMMMMMMTGVQSGAGPHAADTRGMGQVVGEAMGTRGQGGRQPRPLWRPVHKCIRLMRDACVCASFPTSLLDKWLCSVVRMLTPIVSENVLLWAEALQTCGNLSQLA